MDRDVFIMKPGALDTLTSPKGIGIFPAILKIQNVMTEQVYLCTSSHFHPIKDPHDPLCLVWIAESGNHENVTSKVYRSHNFAEMLSLAHKIANERGMTLTVLSTNIDAEVIYDKAYTSRRDSCICSPAEANSGSEGYP